MIYTNVIRKYGIIQKLLKQLNNVPAYRQLFVTTCSVIISTTIFAGSATATSISVKSSFPLNQSSPDYYQKLQGARQNSFSVTSNNTITDSLIKQTNQQLIRNGSTIATRKRSGLKTAISDTQQTALSLLARQSGSGAKARFNSEYGTLALLRLSAPIKALSNRKSSRRSIQALGKAREFFQNHSDLLRLNAPSDTLVLKDQTIDTLNLRHLRFEQTLAGKPVWGQEVILHLDANDNVYQMNGSYVPDDVDHKVDAAIGMSDAIETVRNIVSTKSLPDDTDAQLVYFPQNGSMTLAWKVDARPAINQWFYYFVDASSGDILHRINNIHHGSVASSSGRGLNGNTTTFNSWLDNGTYFLLDPTYPLDDVTPEYDPLANGLNSRGDAIVIDARNSESDLFYITNSNADSGWDPTAVSVTSNARIVYDYYLDEHGRNSLDDNYMNLQSIIHFGENMANAFWNGQFMVYGDGDGRILDSLAKCMDVAAHEMTHGVIQHTANLIYENQSGALNESFADVFAIIIDDDDWLLGEDCTIASPGYTRSMSDPNSGLTYQPDHFDDYQNLPNTEQGDFGGVHINSGIPNKAFYLTATEIGRPSAGKIYYRALNNYLTSSSVFIDAREALEQSAIDLFGENSTEHTAVKDAWDEVGVTEDSAGQSGSTSPTVTDPVTGEDLMVYLRPTNTSSTSFDIYRQTVDNPFTIYNADNDIGPLNTTPASATVPSVFTLSSGTFITYVGTDANLYVIQPGADARNVALSNTGIIKSAAVSPDGRYIAYSTTSAVDDTIHVVDQLNEQETDYQINITTYQQQQTSQAATVRFADSLNFDYTSEKVIFDVLLCTSLPDNACTNDLNTGYNFWTIGTLDLSNQGKMAFPFPSQSPQTSLGYPRFARNNSFVAALDVVTFNGETNNFESGAYTYNFETQQLNPIALLAPNPNAFFTLPNFWGDDQFASFLVPDYENNLVTPAVVAVSEESNWTGANQAFSLNPNFSNFPTMHRTGVRSISRDLEISSDSLNFGAIEKGQSRSLILTLTNNGNTDVDITNISISTDFFKHNATNGRLAQGDTLSIEITFSPADPKNYNATMIISSSGTPASFSVSLSGTNPNGSGSSGGDNGSGSGSSGGGGGGSPFIVILMVISALLVRYRQSHR